MINLIVGALATWRLSHLLIKEDGPYDVFGRLRDAVGITYDERSRPVAGSELAKIFLCFWCMSIWVGLFITLLTAPRRWYINALAYSAVTIGIERYRHG